MLDEAGAGGRLRWKVTEEDGSARLLAAVGESIVGETRLRFESRQPHEHTAFLEGSVDESARGRGVGTAMLRWAEAFARSRQREPSTLRLDVDGVTSRAAELLTANGFTLALAEDQLARGVSSPPSVDLRPHMTLHPWSRETAPEFFRVYEEAFRERPGFPGWSQDQWRAAFTYGDGFRGDLSLLLRSGREPVAYAVCEAVDAATGWILQMGVRPTWRGRGVADRLLDAVLMRFHSDGLSTAMLSVNVNNPRARRAYERAGFRKVGQYQSYRKVLD